METTLVFALYVWIIVSVLALATQLARRVMLNRSRAGQEISADSSVANPQLAPTTALVGVSNAASATTDDHRPIARSQLGVEPVVRSVSAVLAGIDLPCQLTPAIDRAREDDLQHLSLMTDTASPAEVGGSVADELELAGFVVVSDGDDGAIATRSTDVLGMRIISEPSELLIEGNARYPEARPNSVVLEIWLKD